MAAVDGTSRTRRIVVNGEAREAVAVTLAALLEELGYGGQKVATALNGEFVPEGARSGMAVSSDDEVEVVSPRQGG